MSIQLHHHVRVSLDKDRVLGRRNFLRGVSGAAMAAGALSWTDLMTAEAANLRKRGKACILLWMQGGPSQFETFSPKPNHANGGETKAISTSVPGIQVSENLPLLAQRVDELAIIRSMTSREGSHPRASFLLHTGYLPTPTVKHPTLGSIVSREIADPECELPSFVRIGGRFRNVGGGGFLGVQYDPFVLSIADRLPNNAKPTTDIARYRRRLSLLQDLESEAGPLAGRPEVADHQKLYDKTSRMILSSQMKAFNLEKEPTAIRDAYGKTPFGNGCLLARRLVESGVTCVEVSLGNWDTHNDNFNRSKQLCEQLDRPMAQLINDLKQRGMLDNTLVIWMGEFGRTPKINPRTGRDHYPRAFNMALAGGGVQGGRVIGATDAAGATVEDRPVTVPDLFQTFCKSLDINAERENISPIGRPISIVDGGKPIDELFH